MTVRITLKTMRKTLRVKRKKMIVASRPSALMLSPAGGVSASIISYW